MLTVEDYNSVGSKYVNELYTLDTRKISEQEFEKVSYDFCRVSHSINGSEHTFTFEIYNSLWTGECEIFSGNNRSNISESYSSATNTLTVTCPYTHLQLFLYLCSYKSTFQFLRISNLAIPTLNYISVAKNEIGTTKKVPLIYANGQTSNRYIIVSIGVIEKGYSYLLCLLKKTDLIFDLDDTVTVGVINHCRLNVNEEYLPNGSLVDEDLLDIIIHYGDLEIPATYDEELNDYCFDLDLTEKTDNAPVKLTVQVNEIDLVNASTHEVSLNCNYPTADNFIELQSQLVAGAEIIELTNDILFTNSLTLPHDGYIVGGSHEINLSSYQIIVPADVNLKVERVNFSNGQSCFVQKNNSRLTLMECSFINAKMTDTHKGSVISSNNETSIATVTNCTFTNCHHTIYTGAAVTVDNCKAIFNVWNESVDTDYSEFITSYAGTVDITNSVFDIDYDTDYLCSNEIDIEYAQSLIGLSNNTVFNGVTVNILASNDNLPFFQSPYNNSSHIYAKYYYQQLEECIVTSPKKGFEDQSLCHTIIGDDWIYKNNVQVTNPNESNNTKIINLED